VSELEAYRWVIFTARTRIKELERRWGTEMPNRIKEEYSKALGIVEWAQDKLMRTYESD
jgi:hypothetical protein